jgi:hypothetical protein
MSNTAEAVRVSTHTVTKNDSALISNGETANVETTRDEESTITVRNESRQNSSKFVIKDTLPKGVEVVIDDVITDYKPGSILTLPANKPKYAVVITGDFEQEIIRIQNRTVGENIKIEVAYQ